jgi:hypothetical protein
MRPLDFMVIGAQKCGTTALSAFLDYHPEIEISRPKEVHAFDDEQFRATKSADIINRLYLKSFDKNDQFIQGEATPIYLFSPEIVADLAIYNPKLKLIVLLRDPVERAYSQYLMERAEGYEKYPYWLALLAEGLRLKHDDHPWKIGSSHRVHSYRSRGYYSQQLRSVYDQFPRAQVLVLRSSELKDNHDQTLSNVFDFLGVVNNEAPKRIVFSQERTVSEVPVTSYLLRLQYRRELNKLANLVEFSIDDWY